VISQQLPAGTWASSDTAVYLWVGYCCSEVLMPDVRGMTFEEAKPDLEFINSLNGKKILLKGNHDYWWATANKLNNFLAENKLDTISFLSNNAIECEDFIICGTRGWYTEEKNNLSTRNADNTKIIAREVIRLKMSLDEGKKIQDKVFAETGIKKEMLVFMHYPPIFTGYICDELILEMWKAEIYRCYYGHIHGNYLAPAKIEYSDIEFRLVSADFLNFIPKKIEKS
jgi:predicted phosphohydrolase